VSQSQLQPELQRLIEHWKT